METADDSAYFISSREYDMNVSKEIHMQHGKVTWASKKKYV